MTGKILGALLRLSSLLFFCFIAVKLITRILPGDPAALLLGNLASDSKLAHIRTEMNLDRPFLVSFKEDLTGLLHGDLGKSWTNGRAIFPVLKTRALNSILLGVVTLFWVLIFSLLLSLLSVAGNRKAQSLLNQWFWFSTSISSAWIGPLVLLCFSVWIPLFPISGSFLLPSFTLALVSGGYWSKLTETRLFEIVKNGGLLQFEARGIEKFHAIFRHALIPSSPALISLYGMKLGDLMGGAFVVETLFGWQGLGSYLVEAVLSRDFPAVQAGVLACAFLCLSGVVLGDTLQSIIDPRRRIQ